MFGIGTSAFLVFLLNENMKIQKHRWEKSAKDRDEIAKSALHSPERNLLNSEEKKLIASEIEVSPEPETQEDRDRREALRGLLGGKFD